MLLMYNFDDSVSSPHAKQVLLVILGQAKSSLIVFPHVHCHIAHALVFP